MSILEFEHVHRYSDRPHLTVDLFNGQHRTSTAAVVDTGAAFCAFDASLAALLRIDLAGPPDMLVVGIETRPSRFPLRTVRLRLRVERRVIVVAAIDVLFIPRLHVADNIIGRDLLAQVPFAMLHGAGELHLGLTGRS